jgi:Ubiquitin 3 binding protein But2 C-terminal domain
MPGFYIGCDGTIAYNGGTTFYECQTGDHGEANIYLTPGGTNCGQITLNADSCSSGCPPPPPTSCPANLNGAYEFPHLIAPIDSSKPGSAAGTSYFGVVSNTVSSIFNFDIPASDAGKKCSLVFLFPTQSQLATSSFTFSGNGGLDFSLLNGVATSATSYSNAPVVSMDYGTTTVASGNSYTIATFACPANTAISFKITTVGDTYLKYFQDYNPYPIGLYITKC